MERDYLGVAYPMNFVKVNLSRMKVGEHLRGQLIENVPRSVVQEGPKVLSQIEKRDFWAVEIEER